jgi:hypothetical protein
VGPDLSPNRSRTPEASSFSRAAVASSAEENSTAQSDPKAIADEFFGQRRSKA